MHSFCGHLVTEDRVSVGGLVNPKPDWSEKPYRPTPLCRVSKLVACKNRVRLLKVEYSYMVIPSGFGHFTRFRVIKHHFVYTCSAEIGFLYTVIPSGFGHFTRLRVIKHYNFYT